MKLRRALPSPHSSRFSFSRSRELASPGPPPRRTPRIYLSRSMELNDDGQWPEQDEHATYQISGSRTPHAQQPRGCNHPAHAKGAVTSGGLILQQLP